MKRPPSTYRSLIPFTTSAPIADAPLQDHFPSGSQYRTFAHQLDKFDQDLSNAIPWGVYKPADLLLDDESEAMPKTSIYRVMSVAAKSQTNASVRLADEIAAVKRGKKVLVVVKNMAYVAFCISVMMRGYLQVPDHADEIGFDEETAASQNVAPLMKKVKRMRQALQQVTAISPLLALVSEDLTDPFLCHEELLLNMKLLGNDTPAPMRALEDEVWNAILGIVEGRYTSISAYLHLQTVVKNFLGNTTLDTAGNGYFGRLEQQESDVEVTPASPDTSPTSDDSVEQRGADPEARKTPGLSITPSGTSQSDDSAEPEVEARKTPGPSTAPLDASQSDDDSGEQQGTETEATALQNNKHPQPMTNVRDSLPYPNEDTPADMPVDVTKPARRKNPEREASRLPFVKPAGVTKTVKPKNLRKHDSTSAQTPENEVILVDLEDLAPKGETERLKIMKDIITVVKVEDSSVDAQAVEGGTTQPLQLGVLVERYSKETKEMELWDGQGRCHRYKPCVHLKQDYTTWFSIYEACVSNYTDALCLGRPRPKFIDDPQGSLFRCLRQDEYEAMTAPEVQKILSSQSIVITQSAGPKICFDASGIASLNTSLTRETDIQDQSIPDEQGDFSVRVRRGTPKDLLNCSAAPSEMKKSLNALSFPNPLAGIHPSAYATDVRAFFRTGKDEHCVRTLPTEDIRFGLAATEGAHHYWHIDSRGEGTFVRVATGKKIWTLAAPIDPSDVSSTTIWSVDLDVRMLDWSKWRAEMILLNAGDTLLDLMLDTDIGHIPDVSTTAGLSDFLIFACGIELQNCLCNTSYLPTENPILIETLARRNSLSPEEALWKYDVSSMPHETRLHNIASRARVCVILREIFSQIAVMDGAGAVQEPWKFLFFPTLAWYIHALKGYYERSFGQDSLAAKGLSKRDVPDPNLFYRQLEWTSRRWPELKPLVDHLEQQNVKADNLVYALPPFTIRPWDATKAKGDVETGDELFMLGMREGDTSYLSAYASCAKFDPLPASGLRRKFEEDEDEDEDDSAQAKVGAAQWTCTGNNLKPVTRVCQAPANPRKPLASPALAATNPKLAASDHHFRLANVKPTPCMLPSASASSWASQPSAGPSSPLPPPLDALLPTHDAPPPFNALEPAYDALLKENRLRRTLLAPGIGDVPAGRLGVIHAQWDSKVGFEQAFSRQSDRGDEIDEDNPDLVVTGQVWAVPPDQLNLDVAGSWNADLTSANPTAGAASEHASMRKQRKKRQGHKLRRSKQREKDAIEQKVKPFDQFAGYRHKPLTLTRYGKFQQIASALSADALPRSSGPSWIGKRDPKRSKKEIETSVPHNVDTLVNVYGYQLVRYEPGVNKVIVGSNNVMIVGHFDRPCDLEWDRSMAEAERAFAAARDAGMADGTFTLASLQHRRGHFLALLTGVSFGGGQQHPGNLYHQLHAQRVLTQSILQNKAVQQIAGYQSISFNCGPVSISLPHRNYNNLSFGLCALTAFGNFDYTQGGHLALHELKLVFEFPSGTTFQIPSAAIKHSNTPIQDGEERYSMAQYAAGGLFCWVAYGNKTAATLQSTNAGHRLKESVDMADGERWRDRLAMYSTTDSFFSDHSASPT
ncbi:hypothetical protein H1R20_g6240, partial [Candolleomyces eurysporus]